MIKNDALYSVKEASEILEIKLRTMQYYAKKLDAKMIDGRYLFTGHQLKEIRAQKVTQKRAQRKSIKALDATLTDLIRQIDNVEYIREVLTAIKQGDILERLTEQEYDQFISRLKEANQLEQRIVEYKEEIKRMEAYVEDYRQNVEYLKKSLDSQQRQTEILLGSLRERNYIEAKEKKFDT